MGYLPQIGSGDKMAKTYPTRPIAQYKEAYKVYKDVSLAS